MTKHTTCLTTEETNNTCDVKHAKRRLACSVCLTRVCVCVCVCQFSLLENLRHLEWTLGTEA